MAHCEQNPSGLSELGGCPRTSETKDKTVPMVQKHQGRISSVLSEEAFAGVTGVCFWVIATAQPEGCGALQGVISDGSTVGQGQLPLL